MSAHQQTPAVSAQQQVPGDGQSSHVSGGGAETGVTAAQATAAGASPPVGTFTPGETSINAVTRAAAILLDDPVATAKVLDTGSGSTANPAAKASSVIPAVSTTSVSGSASLADIGPIGTTPATKAAPRRQPGLLSLRPKLRRQRLHRPRLQPRLLLRPRALRSQMTRWASKMKLRLRLTWALTSR